ncbi:MAG: hexitol phosphatase HxpB [Bacteroidota bacterium]
MINTVIFDMDGILIDSEPLWKKAEREIFSSLGVTITNEKSSITASMTTNEVVDYWFEQFPWGKKNTKKVENAVINLVGELILQEGNPVEGISDILEIFRQRSFNIGLATNSPYRLIPIVLDKVGITHYFDAVSSAEHEHQGKPNPLVYLSTAKKLAVNPTNCIVFEDSESGIKAAKNANMKVIAVPPEKEFNNPKFDIADMKLSKLSAFTAKHLATF